MAQQLTKLQKQNVELAESRVQVIVREAEAYLKPIGIDPPAFLRATVTALWRDPALAEADERSFKLALLKCAQTGLMPDGESAALVTFGSEVTLIPMVHGLIDIVRRNVPGIGIESNVIRTWDDFELVRGTSPVLRYVSKPIPDDAPYTDLNDIRTMTGAYCIISLPPIVPYAEPIRETHHMFKYQIEAVRSRVKSSRNPGSPWVNFTSRMYEKTVLRAALRRMPSRHQTFAAFDPKVADDFTGKTIRIDAEPEPVAAILPPNTLPI